MTENIQQVLWKPMNKSERVHEARIADGYYHTGRKRVAESGENLRGRMIRAHLLHRRKVTSGHGERSHQDTEREPGFLQERTRVPAGGEPGFLQEENKGSCRRRTRVPAGGEQGFFSLVLLQVLKQTIDFCPCD
ncbi:hypothetical protein JOQ06_005888 [Pogonophryne albipinna]|uniref:Uncharacterized protein n=1 Tax=Pogonophryne albipinna TaxID=1090488 RepID=A0AAD6BJQ4_9TELE|nr:hypothetical protein JOQ06_005888 [Pogonophryne albipinna]